MRSVVLAIAAGLAAGATLSNVTTGQYVGESIVIPNLGTETLILADDGGNIHLFDGPVTVPPGSVVRLTWNGSRWVTGANTAQCFAASAVDGGCLTAGDQEIGGAKTFKSPITSEKTITVSGSNEAVVAPYVAATVWCEAPVFTNGNNGQTTKMIGMKTEYDPGPDNQIWSYLDRDAGEILSINNGYLNRQRKVAAVTNTGQIAAGCNQASNVSGDDSSFIDCSTESGHVALSAPDGYHLNIRGMLGTDHAAIETDGGCPVPDGGTWVVGTGGTGIGADGGICASYYRYAGLHGNVTSRSGTGASSALYAGWQQEWLNPLTGGFSDKTGWIDAWGGFGHGHQLSFAQLRAIGPSVLIITTLGQFKYGMQLSALNYAFDTNRLTLRTDVDLYSIPITNDVLSVHNGEASPRAMEDGASTFSTGSRAVSFGTNFASAPKCFCSDTTDVTKGCGPSGTNAGSTTFVGTGSDGFDWFCVGPK